jgi:hypothetical protein
MVQLTRRSTYLETLMMMMLMLRYHTFIYTIETLKWTIFRRTSLHSNVEASHPRVKFGFVPPM